MNKLDFSFLLPYVPQLVQATKVTVLIGVLSFGMALLVAAGVGVARSQRIPKWVGFPLSFYVETFRGTPLLIQLFFIYYGLPTLGVLLEPMTAAVLGLSLNSGAYMSEVVRAAISSVDRGQYEAAYCLGYRRTQVYHHIILPQAFRIALPTFMNYFSTVIKETSLISMLSITEITRLGNHIYAKTLSPFEIYLSIGAIYLVLTLAVSLLSKSIEKNCFTWNL